MLRDHHHQVTERNVIVTAVPNAPGSLAPALKLIGDASVNVEYAYGGGAEGSPTATIVLGVEDAAARVGRRGRLMKLYVETMDATVVDVDADGRVRLENEEWSQPTLQERRAIIHAAQQEIAALAELIENPAGATR